jgi:ribosomal protein L11 methyltransferase
MLPELRRADNLTATIGAVIDYILDISFDSADSMLEEEVQSRLFLTTSSGSSAREVNGTTTISAYFDSPASRADGREALRDVPSVELFDADRERVDWLEHYQQSLEPILIGEEFLVTPDASLIPPGNERHTLIIPQEQAFGTGSHETTALCIELLTALGVRDLRGLDIGSGSGILALAMLRLGARKVIAFDNDPDAYGALRDNRMRNDVAPADLPLFIGSVEALRGGLFDVVTMNIIPEVILPLLPDVVPHVGRTLILSGILLVKRDDVVRACASHGLTLAGERARGEWWAGAFAVA